MCRFTLLNLSTKPGSGSHVSLHLDCVSNAALALSSEECLEHFRQELVSAVVRRLTLANETLALHGQPAKTAAQSARLELAPLDDPAA